MKDFDCCYDQCPEPGTIRIGANGGDSRWICFRHLERWNETRARFLADGGGCEMEELGELLREKSTSRMAAYRNLDFGAHSTNEESSHEKAGSLAMRRAKLLDRQPDPVRSDIFLHGLSSLTLESMRRAMEQGLVPVGIDLADDGIVILRFTRPHAGCSKHR
jgi:hypothetical protein